MSYKSKKMRSKKISLVALLCVLAIGLQSQTMADIRQAVKDTSRIERSSIGKDNSSSKNRLNDEPENAAYWYSKFISETKDAEDLLNYAKVLQSTGACEDAVRWYKRYADRGDKHQKENRDFIKSCAEEKVFNENSHVKIENVKTTFNRSGNMMFFTRNNNDGKSKKGLIDLKIYMATKNVDGYWANMEELEFNSDEFTTCHPTLSPDGRRLYFASNRPGGYGGLDIYVVESMLGGWSTPQNLGPTVNSSDNEIDFGFWINEDKSRGYLSSSRHDGYGKDDIYEWTADNNKLAMGGMSYEMCVTRKAISNQVH